MNQTLIIYELEENPNWFSRHSHKALIISNTLKLFSLCHLRTINRTQYDIHTQTVLFGNFSTILNMRHIYIICMQIHTASNASALPFCKKQPDNVIGNLFRCRLIICVCALRIHTSTKSKHIHTHTHTQRSINEKQYANIKYNEWMNCKNYTHICVCVYIHIASRREQSCRWLQCTYVNVLYTKNNYYLILLFSFWFFRWIFHLIPLFCSHGFVREVSLL